MGWRITRHFLAMTAIVLLGGFACATLVRFAPGFSADERQLDSRLSADSLRALRESHESERNILRFYADYMRRALHGELGASRSLGQPVRSLLRDRFPVTVRLVGVGLALGWIVGLSLSLTTVLMRVTAYSAIAI